MARKILQSVLIQQHSALRLLLIYSWGLTLSHVVTCLVFSFHTLSSSSSFKTELTGHPGEPHLSIQDERDTPLAAPDSYFFISFPSASTDISTVSQRSYWSHQWSALLTEPFHLHLIWLLRAGTQCSSRHNFLAEQIHNVPIHCGLYNTSLCTSYPFPRSCYTWSQTCDPSALASAWQGL